MIDITKQYTYNGKPVRIYADGSDTAGGGLHCAALSDDSDTKDKWYLLALYESDVVEAWIPTIGEIVWFWDSCTPHRPTARKFGCQVVDENGDLYFEDSEQNPFTDCAPFTGTLPEAFKGL